MLNNTAYPVSEGDLPVRQAGSPGRKLVEGQVEHMVRQAHHERTSAGLMATLFSGSQEKRLTGIQKSVVYCFHQIWVLLKAWWRPKWETPGSGLGVEVVCSHGALGVVPPPQGFGLILDWAGG